MNTFAPAAELQALEKLRDEELEEARALQSVMLPSESLRSRGVTISHQLSRFRRSAAIFWTTSKSPTAPSGCIWAMSREKGFPPLSLELWQSERCAGSIKQESPRIRFSAR
jgi:hypothetical protein